MNQLSATSRQSPLGRSLPIPEVVMAAGAALCFVLDDEPAIGWVMTTALTSFGVTAQHFTTASAMFEVLGHRTPEIIFLDLFLGDTDAIDTLRELARIGFVGAVQI